MPTLNWLTREEDIGQGEMRGWLSRLVSHLVEAWGMHIAALMRCKFILASKVREKIAAARRRERAEVYQRHLLAPDAKTEVSFDNAFVFEDGMYQDERRYRGRSRYGREAHCWRIMGTKERWSVPVPDRREVGGRCRYSGADSREGWATSGFAFIG